MSTCDVGWPTEDEAEDEGEHLGSGGGGKGGGTGIDELLKFDWEHNLISPEAATGADGCSVVPLKKVAGLSRNADDAMQASVVRACEALRIKECKAAAGESSTFDNH